MNFQISKHRGQDLRSASHTRTRCTPSPHSRQCITQRGTVPLNFRKITKTIPTCNPCASFFYFFRKYIFFFRVGPIPGAKSSMDDARRRRRRSRGSGDHEWAGDPQRLIARNVGTCLWHICIENIARRCPYSRMRLRPHRRRGRSRQVDNLTIEARDPQRLNAGG